ncbi:hypothetical protein DPMN_007239 [Dreissena polymorpha]|uniref:Uncharacterized protein n=1 Tax=Dreissena polymorpha TaxID=45954 RepID=A0A9D4MX03_DREPO|nr:hypothetical protein DPMN_007239 [Dreissena polymorpha]
MTDTLYIIETNLLIKFHEDWTINVASRVLTRKNAPPPDIIGINLLTKFHKDWTINVASRVLTRKNSPPLDSHVFQANVTIFKLIQYIIEKTNVASRVLTRKNALPPGGHVFQPTCIIFELFQDIIEMNLLTKFHEDWTINVASTIYSHIRKNAPPLGSHVFQAKVTIFELIQDIIGKNLLSKFHEARKINVDSIEKNALLPGSHVFQPTAIIFKLFHEDQTIDVVSRVLTRFYYSHLRKNALPLGSHVFQANITILELNRHIQKRHVLAKFHKDWTKNVTSTVFTCFHYIHIEKTAPPPGGHTNVSTKFHDDWAKIVTSRVFTRFLYSHIKNTAPPPGCHVFQRTGTIFELNQFTKDLASNVTSIVFKLSRGINGTNVLTKFHEDRTINVASRVFTRQNVDDIRRTTDKRRHKSLP